MAVCNARDQRNPVSPALVENFIRVFLGGA
jgi:hypothetical protein